GIAAVRLAQQPAGVGQLVGRVEVEGGFGHGGGTCQARTAFFLAAGAALAANGCDNRYSSSRPTGRPVAPLAAPLFQAVPAMSRCAHGNLPTKRCRNLAAVMAPPARPATLATSAKLVFRPSEYSSSSGRRHTRSPATSPAVDSAV